MKSPYLSQGESLSSCLPLPLCINNFVISVLSWPLTNSAEEPLAFICDFFSKLIHTVSLLACSWRECLGILRLEVTNGVRKQSVHGQGAQFLAEMPVSGWWQWLSQIQQQLEDWVLHAVPLLRGGLVLSAGSAAMKGHSTAAITAPHCCCC